MSDEKSEKRNLEGEQDWDFDQAELQRPARSGRTVVSVSVSKEDFDRLARHASRLGLRTSEFIRESALQQLRSGADQKAVIYGVSGGGGAIIFNVNPLPTTAASKVTQEFETKMSEQLAIAI